MYAITCTPYLNTHTHQYEHVLKINKRPTTGELAKIVATMNPPKLSTFSDPSSRERCMHVLKQLPTSNNIRNTEYMGPEDVPELFEFLIENGYIIDTSLTKMMQQSKVQLSTNLICYVKESK